MSNNLASEQNLGALTKTTLSQHTHPGADLGNFRVGAAFQKHFENFIDLFSGRSN